MCFIVSQNRKKFCNIFVTCHLSQKNFGFPFPPPLEISDVDFVFLHLISSGFHYSVNALLEFVQWKIWGKINHRFNLSIKIHESGTPNPRRGLASSAPAVRMSWTRQWSQLDWLQLSFCLTGFQSDARSFYTQRAGWLSAGCHWLKLNSELINHREMFRFCCFPESSGCWNNSRLMASWLHFFNKWKPVLHVIHYKVWNSATVTSSAQPLYMVLLNYWTY